MDLGSRLRPLTDMSPGGWIVERTGAFGSGVGALVPAGFEAYARILHPAWGAGDVPVRWAEVARWSGGVLHARAQFAALARSADGRDRPWQEAPWVGELPLPDREALYGVLRRHTGSERGLIAFWDGHGALGEISEMPRLRLPHRDYLLYEGELEAAVAGVEGLAPDLWWPADRSWYVAADIDLDSTYLGGTAALVAELVGDPKLEVLQVSFDDPITRDGDQINR
ncbi:hypothetical protein LO762_02865 [Actinocorallia sp. API 0066]|uniref:hypothetical protein n=1 Tax=Actinocorallia sp. API 0066 TaxID=2896846 RepID=UPI001E5D1001|nr:hypothetical protein [Actinocorallia sp. API 0066]MCD0448142.1 hypothetical protein [Actinocorallia sp. API 0066]